MSFVFAAIKINSMRLQCYGKNSPLKWSWSLATQINIINRLSLFPSAAELERGDISPYPGAVSPIDTQNLKQLTILELKHATNNFSEINIIGEGSFGLAYKGLLQDGSLVVIKRHLHTQIQNFLHEVTLALGSLSILLLDDRKLDTSIAWIVPFRYHDHTSRTCVVHIIQISVNMQNIGVLKILSISELISMLSCLDALQVKHIARVHHRHLVKLVGFCEENHQQLLIYDYIPNGNVQNHLYGNPFISSSSFLPDLPLSIFLFQGHICFFQIVKVCLLGNWPCGKDYQLL